jgi:hypothetical protein
MRHGFPHPREAPGRTEMSKRVWLTLALAAVAAASSAASSVAAKPHAASESRPNTVTRGLDYLHSRQTDAGGFSTMANTAWGILGAVASGERMGNRAWSVNGKNPFEYLQANSHEAAANADTNAPVYYARAIMAYAAVDRVDRIPVAGTPSVNLLNRLTAYQDWVVDTSTGSGSFSPWNPSNPPSHRMDVHTTAWAIIALSAIREDGTARFARAVSWLSGQANGDGGFPAQSGETSNIEDTAMAAQALIAGGIAENGPVILAARAFILGHQKSGGGFPYKPAGDTEAEATSGAIQAAFAMGEDPRTDPDWKSGINTPERALSLLQGQNGSYASTHGSTPRPMISTSWALIALRGRPFTTYPLRVGSASPAFRFRPWIKSISPKNGAKYNHTRIVLIRATYTDGAKGTGVKPSACRVYVDNVNKSKPADIGRYGLHLQLKNVANGDHTYKLVIVDYAGNSKTVENKFKVNVATPIPTPTPTTAPTYNPVPNPIYPTPKPVTPNPVDTLYPTTNPTASGSPTPYSSVTPYASGAPVTGAPVASPSPSGSPGAAGGGGGGSAAGFLGGTLLAMLPIGALLSYFAFRRRELALSGASSGKVLEGGGSSWERVKQALGKSKDIVKPAGS